MRKLLLLLIISSFPLIGFSQYNWDFGAHGGAANYLGEIGGGAGTRRDFVADMKIKETEFAMGGYARYKFNQYLGAKLGFNWVRIDGNDAQSSNHARVGRNLSFQNDVLELELTGQVTFYEMPDLGHTYRYKNDFKMYVFGGVSGFYNNPKAYYQGSWVKLRPLETEGKKYSAVDVAIPLGLGFYFTLNKHQRIGWEFDWRTTFTDYLDDVSGNYVDKTGSSPEAIALANRNPELSKGTDASGSGNYGYNAKQTNKRGDPSHKDSYMSTSVTYSYVLRGHSSLYKSKYGSIFRKVKNKKHKVKAKF